MSLADTGSDSESRRDSKSPSLPPARKTGKDVPAQQSIDKFWKKFTTKNPGKLFTVLPDNHYAQRAVLHASRKASTLKNAVASYEQAAATCKAKVEKIVKDCRRLNQKYKDTHFDIEFDFMKWQWGQHIEDCLVALSEDHAHLRPMSVKRIEDIFDKPHFYIDGMTANDVRQGRDGDCWFMSSICTLSNKEDLLEKVCVARDEKVGVYGFVFHRDGEWISEVVDDKLYLTKEDFHESLWERYDWLTIDMPNPDDEYQKVMQTGSKALYFAQCRDQNETWLPLLEKAYAKAHGDYGAIEGGWVGEGLEDLTGGVTSELFAADILDKDKFWTDELMNVNKLFLFGLAQMGGKTGERRGIIEKHAYSIMEAKELDNFRLLKIRNPWGKKEWDGPWSDGSEEWTPDRMRRLNHQFGNDGVFWISYKDLLKHFQHIDRTRLFDAEWSVTQHWTSVNVPWSVNYLDSHFKISLSKASPVVIVLSQLDDRYFQGLTGQYYFQLQYRLHKDGEAEYIARSKPSYFMNRSATTELDLEAGQYLVMIKVTASRDKSRTTPEEVVKKTCQTRPEKLMAVGLSYDLAHAKGHFKESQVERKERLQKERRDKRRLKAKKVFEAQRKVQKKEKLRRLRWEAKEKAKTGTEPQGDLNTDSTIEISIKVGESTLKPTKSQNADRARGETRVVSQERGSKQLKIIVETSDPNESTKGGDHITSEEIGQPSEGGDKQSENVKQALEGAKDEHEGEGKRDDDTDVKDVSATESGQEKGKERLTSISSTVIVTPATSTESSAVTKDSDKAEVQPGVKLDDNTSTGEKVTDTEITTETGGNADQSNMVENNVSFEKLTLDNISDDGLSWNSDIDAPSDSSSDSESGSESDSDSDADEPAPSPAPNDPSADDDPTNDPWNAVCVFGLRLYSKGSHAEIEVVRKQDGENSVESKKLDVDDQAADATKKLQRGSAREERELESVVGTAPAWNEESKQG